MHAQFRLRHGCISELASALGACERRRGAPSAKPRPISPDLEVGIGLARLGLARVTGVCLYVYVICVVCTHAIYLTPETTYVRALLASKIWRSATRYLACHSATCVDARARELKAFVHSTINA